MADYYQKVATPQTQFRQQATPSGPSVDANAQAEARNDAQSNLGAALMSLVGTAATVSNIQDQMSAEEKRRMKVEHQLDIDSDLSNLGSFSTAYIDGLDSNKKITDYTPRELRDHLEKASDEYIKANGLGDKPYFDVLKEDMDAKKLALFNRQAGINKETQKELRYGSFMSQVKSTFRASNSPEDIVAELKDSLTKNVGIGSKQVEIDGEMVEITPSIQDTEDNAKLRMLQPIIESVMTDRDPKALQLLESKEFKEFFDVPDYKNVVNSAKQQVQSTLNKNRRVSYDKMEEAGFFAMESGMFTKPSDIETFMKEQLAPLDETNRPETKRIIGLKSALMESLQAEMTFQQNYEAIKSGDYTILQRSNMPKKQIEAMENKFFTVETGIQDLSPQGITEAVKSGQFDAQLKSYFSEGYPIPPYLEKWANTAPSGGISGLRDKHDTFLQLNTLMQDTNKSALDIFNPKEYGRMMFLGNLVDNIDSGVLDDKEALSVYSTFNNDLEKNVDSFGTFISQKAATELNSEATQKWLSDVKTDAPWTIDEFSSQAYMERQFKNYFSYAMEATDDPEQARSMAEDMFYKRHTAFENPDGSEGVIPYEFKALTVEDFTKIAENDPDSTIESLREAAGYLGTFKEYEFRSNLSFKPDPSYEKNKLMNLYYDGKFIKSYSAESMMNNIKVINAGNVSRAEERNVSRTQGR